MKLTIQQRGYMTERLAALAKKRIAAEVTAKLGTKPEAPVLTFEQKCDLVRTGKAKLKPQNKLSDYTDLKDAFEFPHPERERALKAVAAYDAKAEKIGDVIMQEKQRIVDMLMLGEASDALSALEAFEKKVPA